MQNTYLETEKHEERKYTTREGSLLRFLIFFSNFLFFFPSSLLNTYSTLCTLPDK